LTTAGRMTAWTLATGLIGLAACVGVVVLLARPGEDRPPATDGPVPQGTDSRTAAEPPAGPLSPAPVGPPAPRRLPVGGATGYVVVIEPDGSSYLEDPSGRRTVLAEAAPVPAPPEVRPKAAPPAKTTVGQLIVCDTGVVDVPTGAVITFVGRDKVVTRDEAGGSTTYYTDGRVEAHVRERKDAPPTKKP
jgi:hypothetical protein